MENILNRALGRVFVNAYIIRTNKSMALLEEWNIGYEDAVRFIAGRKDLMGNKLVIASSEQKALLTSLLFERLLEKGRFIRSGQRIFYFKECKLIDITASEFEREIAHPLVRSIVKKDYIITFLMHFYEEYEEVEVYRDFHYDKRKNTIYISDRISGYWEITESFIERRMNGHNNIFFEFQENTEKDFEFVNPDFYNIKTPLEFFKTFNYDEIFLSRDEYAKLLYAYMLTVIFEADIQSKAILMFIGEKGSGKSTLGREMLRFLISRRENVTRIGDKEEELDVVLTNRRFAVLDNLEKTPRWLEDTLAIASTSGKKQKRQLYTTNNIIEYQYRCFIVINAINPKLRRADIVDRLILINLKRIERFLPDSDIGLCTDPLLLKSYYAGFFTDLQKMLREIRNNNKVPNVRLAGFFKYLAIALKIIDTNNNEIDNIIRRLSNALQDYAIAEDDVVLAIKCFFEIETNIDEILTNKTKKEIKDVTGKELLEILKGAGLPDTYTTQRVLARLRNIKSNLEKEGFLFISRIGSHNKRLYTIKRL